MDFELQYEEGTTNYNRNYELFFSLNFERVWFLNINAIERF